MGSQRARQEVCSGPIAGPAAPPPRAACASTSPRRRRKTGTSPAGNGRPTSRIVAEREGFEPPVPQAVQQISSLPHSTPLPSLRGSRILSGGGEFLLPADVGTQCRWDGDGAIRVLVVLQDRDQRAADREP